MMPALKIPKTPDIFYNMKIWLSSVNYQYSYEILLMECPNIDMT